MKLLELIKAVNDSKLTREQIEAYRDEMANLFAQIQFERADIKKKRAIFMVEQAEKTSVATKNKWHATPDGQREIELDHYSVATVQMLASLKSRIYSLII